MAYPSLISRPDARRIGLVADTHVPDRAPSLNPRLFESLQGVHLILHAGDISSPAVLEALSRIAEPVAVRGNNRGDGRCFNPSLPEKRLIEIAHGFRIGLFHGVETFYQRITDVIIGRSGFTARCACRILKRMMPLFPDADCTVYGHGHWPVVHFQEGKLFVNPGKAFGQKESTCGILEIQDDCVRVMFLPLGTPGRLESLVSKWYSFPPT